MNITGTIDANGSTQEMVYKTPDVEAGIFLHLEGTFDGATISVQYLAADGTWRTIAAGSYTANQTKIHYLPNGVRVRLNTASAGVSTDVFYELTAMSGR